MQYIIVFVIDIGTKWKPNTEDRLVNFIWMRTERNKINKLHLDRGINY